MWTTPLFYTWTAPLFGVVHNTHPGRLHPIPDDSTLVRTTPFYLGRVRFLGKVHSLYTIAIVVVVVVVVVVVIGVGVVVVVVVVLKASRLPRQKQQRHVKSSSAHPTQVVAELPRTSMKVLKVPRLPRKPSRKRHACHVKSSGAHPTQFVAELPRTPMKVLQAPRLPRKWSLRC